MLLRASLVSIDERVREHVTNMLTTPPVSAEIVGAGVRVEQVSALVLKAGRDHSVDHAPMVLLAAAARSDMDGDQPIRVYAIGMGELVTMLLGTRPESSESVLMRLAND